MLSSAGIILTVKTKNGRKQVFPIVGGKDGKELRDNAAFIGALLCFVFLL